MFPERCVHHTIRSDVGIPDMRAVEDLRGGHAMSNYEEHNHSEQIWVDAFSLIVLSVLGARLVQGFVYWGGASRRLIYDFHDIAGVDHAVKLDMESTGFVASKMVHALPGVLWIQEPIEWTLANPALLEASVWLWTIAELVVGLGLILGLLTRLMALASVGLNIALMMIFGWMGSTCLDEWTMAVSGVAMSAAVLVAGGGKVSLDHAIMGPAVRTTGRSWLTWLTSGALAPAATRRLALWLAFVCAVFTVGSYQVLFGAVVSPLDPRVSFHRHALALSDVDLSADGAVALDAYVDAGPDTGAAYVIAVTLEDEAGTVVARWDGDTLANLPESAIENAYPYVWAAHFKTEIIGFSGATGARARISLPAPQAGMVLTPGSFSMTFQAIDGTTWSATADLAR